MKTEGYKVKSYSQPVKRYCQTLSLRDNPELIEAYRKAHSKEEAWPEIRAGSLACRGSTRPPFARTHSTPDARC